MAVTGAIFNSLTFGGVNSADYGIYITGEAVFNAPERAVEMVDVPGRNGAIALDQGRWENIEVEYPAGTFGMNEVEFKTALSNFRNAIVSQIGYQKLTDTYHHDEYRMAMYVSGLDVSPKHYNSAGEFKLTFNCKPQRWLANGETAITVASGDTLYNPTQYDAGPLMMIEGYGNLGINGHNINVRNVVVGDVLLKSGFTAEYRVPSYSISPAEMPNVRLMDGGDKATISIDVDLRWTPKGPIQQFVNRRAPALTPEEGSYQVGQTIYTVGLYVHEGVTDRLHVICRMRLIDLQFEYPSEVGTENVISYIGDCQSYIELQDGTTYDYVQTTAYLRLRIRREESGLRLIVEAQANADNTHPGLLTPSSTGTLIISDIVGHSTQTVLGHPTYIDCDAGEVYKIGSDGKMTSLNLYVSLGADLPVLSSGENEITANNTITELKIKPNWWKL